MQIWPVHNLESAISKTPCQVGLQNCQKLPYAGQRKEQLVNVALPQLPISVQPRGLDTDGTPNCLA